MSFASPENQLPLFEGLPTHLQAIVDLYRGGKPRPNHELYEAVAKTKGQSLQDFTHRVHVGRDEKLHCTNTRQVRWFQQDLKRLGWLEPAKGERGRWQLTARGRKALTPQRRGTVLLGYSTELGVCLWANCEDVIDRIDEPITLMLSSPVYPLAKARAYGGVPLDAYVDWLTAHIEPIVAKLRDGGVIALNLSNDIFQPGSPARSTYREELVLALTRRLGLYKMESAIWVNPCKPPGPVQWASIKRVQLGVAYEPVEIFSNNPHACRADNRRVLQPHLEKQLELMRRGGERRSSVFSDGAYRLHEGSYGRMTEGRIPRNVLTYAHNGRDPDLKRAKAHARAIGLPTHGAPMPLGLAQFLVRYLSEEGDLVLDNMSGWNTTGYAAEVNGRRWIACEKHAEYVIGGAERFRSRPGFETNFPAWEPPAPLLAGHSQALELA
jgi:hypothetical protein